MDKKNQNLKLSECPKCGKVFYVKTKSKEEIKTVCPYCENEVSIKINGAREEEDIKDEI